MIKKNPKEKLIFFDLQTGDALPGWPKTIPNWPQNVTHPNIARGDLSFADINGDGRDELVINLFFWSVSDNLGPDRILIYSLDGTLLSDWGKDKIPGYSTPVIGDVNKDNKSDFLLEYPVDGLILIDSSGTKLMQKANFGQYLPGVFEYHFPRFLTDLDKDGKPEVFGAAITTEPIGNKSALVLYDYSDGQVSSGALSWVTYNHDYQNTRALSTVDAGADSDGDGFKNSIEQYIGTNPNLKCGVNAWPPDINNDKYVNLFDDILAVAYRVGSNNPRYDLNGGGKVDSADVNIVASYFGKTCQ